MDWSMQCWAAFPQGQEVPTYLGLRGLCTPVCHRPPFSITPELWHPLPFINASLLCSGAFWTEPCYLEVQPRFWKLWLADLCYVTRVPEHRTRVRGAQRYSRMFISSPKHPQDRYMMKKSHLFSKGSKSKFLAHHNQRRNYKNQSTIFTGSFSVLATSHEPLRRPSVFP